MLDRFLKYLQEHSLGNSDEKVLLAISGGLDSVTLLHLYHVAGFKLALAHCNFQLRDEESNGDEEFVRNLAEKYSYPLFAAHFNTREYCHRNRISIQMGARELRYDWFKQIACENGFKFIAIAHNKNDVAETMLLNLIRGTGLKGLTGIRPKTDTIIRPLLFASRTEIAAYAREQALEYREDSSNLETKYHRNLIRSEIMPLMQRINPSLLDTLLHERDVFYASYALYEKEIGRIRKSLSTREGALVKLSIASLLALRITAPVLYDLLSPFNFSYSDAEDILNCLQGESGKMFYSDQYILVKDRNYLLVEKKHESVRDLEYMITEGDTELRYPVNLRMESFSCDRTFDIPADRLCASLDYDKLSFPLTVRHWKEGDYFIPLGMQGKKKLSDFFTDQKMSIPDKKKQWLLCSGDNIVWIMGRQIDERYKIATNTKNVLSICLID